MLGQLTTLVRYRLIMLRRTWFGNSAGQMAGILVGLFAVLLVLLGLGLAVGMFFAGWRLFGKSDSSAMLLFMDPVIFVILMFWLAGVMKELQRLDVLDFRKMLYLPVSLRMVFLLNFTASLVTPILPLFAFGALGLALGLGLGVGSRMLLVPFLAAAFFVMLAAWTYHFRGWLGVLMENKRRRRMILTIIPIVFVLISQAPNFFANFLGSSAQQSHHVQMESLIFKGVVANALLPPGWLALGMKALHERDYAIALLCFAGMSALGGLGLSAGYRGTYRYYTAATTRRGRAKAETPKAAPSFAHEPLTARRIPGLSEDTAAVAFASWLTAVRHPTVRMQIVMPFIFGTIFMLPMVLHKGSTSNPFQGQTMIGMVLFMILMGFGVFLVNLFGTDPEGFQALVLLPTPRRRYLLGKNLAFFPIVGLLFALFAGMAALVTRPSFTLMGIIALQFFQIFLSLCLVGNFMSIMFPHRMRKDSMNASGGAPGRLFETFISLLGLPFLLIPTGLTLFAHVGLSQLPGFERVPWGIIVAGVFVTVTAIAYTVSLGPAGRLLQAREQKILDALRKDQG